jgi:hypothetical protein
MDGALKLANKKEFCSSSDLGLLIIVSWIFIILTQIANLNNL